MRGESTRGLFERLRSAQTLPVVPMDPIAVDDSWLEPRCYHRGPIHDSELPAGFVRFDAGALTYTEVLWAAQRADEWTYTRTATARYRPCHGQHTADRVAAAQRLQTGNVHFARITATPWRQPSGLMPRQRHGVPEHAAAQRVPRATDDAHFRPTRHLFVRFVPTTTESNSTGSNAIINAY